MKCPKCFKSFEHMYTVHTTSKQPFTGVNAMEGLTAYGAIQAEKELLCHVGDFVHFRFVNDEEERLVRMVEFNQQDLHDKHEEAWNSLLPCEHENCTERGIPCYINWIDEEPNERFCSEHAYEHGYCSNCGIFSAGIESFDFHNPAGLCDNCQGQLASEIDNDYYDEDADFGWEYPEWSDIIEGEEGGRYIGEGSDTEGGDE